MHYLLPNQSMENVKMPVYVQYYFWLAPVSAFCFLLERIKPFYKWIPAIGNRE
jgi:hypothetical protein